MGPLGLNGLLRLGLLFPKGEFLKELYRGGPIGRVAIITLTYMAEILFPKGEFLKELYRGVPLVEWLSLPLLIPPM